MRSAHSSRFPLHLLRFSLSGMLEYVTICAILCALIPLIGPWSAVFLMLTALAIAAGQGDLALAALGIAVVLDPFFDSTSAVGQLITMGVAAVIGIWFRWRWRPEVDNRRKYREISRNIFVSRTELVPLTVNGTSSVLRDMNVSRRAKVASLVVQQRHLVTRRLLGVADKQV